MSAAIETRGLTKRYGDIVAVLMPPVALLASIGRGYLAPVGWAILTVFLAQILVRNGGER